MGVRREEARATRCLWLLYSLLMFPGTRRSSSAERMRICRSLERLWIAQKTG